MLVKPTEIQKYVVNLFQYHKPLQHKTLSAKMGRNLSELGRFNNPRTKYDRKMYEAENMLSMARMFNRH